MLRVLNEVKQDEDCEEMLKTGSLANVLCAESWGKKHMKNNKTRQSKEETVVVKRLSEEKSKDVIEFLKMLENI